MLSSSSHKSPIEKTTLVVWCLSYLWGNINLWCLIDLIESYVPFSLRECWTSLLVECFPGLQETHVRLSDKDSTFWLSLGSPGEAVNHLLDMLICLSFRICYLFDDKLSCK